MGLSIIKGDILNLPKEFDAIAIPGRYNLELIGNIGGKLSDIAGPKLELELSQYKEIGLTKCAITNAYNLNCKKIIHIANPKYNPKNPKVAKQLKDSYLNALYLAYNFDLKSIAFASLSTGVYMYPIKEATEIALSTMSEFLLNHEMEIALVIYTQDSFNACKDIFDKFKVNIIDGQLFDKDPKINEHFRTLDQTDEWYAEKYEKVKRNAIAERIADVMNEIINENKLDLKGNKDEYYTFICCKSAYYSIINGKKEPCRDTIIGLGINMCFNSSQIDEVLSVKNARLDINSNRDRIIMDIANKNFNNCVIKKKGVMAREDSYAVNEKLIKQGLFPLKGKTSKKE